VILFIISAYGTSKHFLLTIAIMITSYRASSWSRAFRKLIFRVFTHIISITLPLVTRFTEMSVTPTKPLCNTTAKFTFKLNKVFTMFRAVLDRNVTTFRTYKLLWFKRTSCILCFIHRCHTIFSASEVRSFALETHEVCIDYHSVIFRFSIINWCFFCKFWIRFLKFFKFKSI